MSDKKLKKIKPSNREAFTTSIDSELKRKLKIYCAVHDKNQNDVLEELLKKLLEEDGGDNGYTN